jgi:hypothetical protein
MIVIFCAAGSKHNFAARRGSFVPLLPLFRLLP